MIVSSEFEPYDNVGFDHVEAERSGLKFGATAQVFPDDTGAYLKFSFHSYLNLMFQSIGRSFPTSGKLVGLNREESVFEIKGSQGLLRCHFPRLGFTIRPEKSANSKL